MPRSIFAFSISCFSWMKLACSSQSRAFPRDSSQRGPYYKQGRSLRDFDLQTHLFRCPLSYMIYDPAFDALPDVAKQQVYRKLFVALTGQAGGSYKLVALATSSTNPADTNPNNDIAVEATI